MGLPPLAGEADDEDEEEEAFSFRDSGIGTSVEDGKRGGRRRRGAAFTDARGL